MKRLPCALCMIVILLKGAAQGETFVKRTVVSGLNSPWEITYGPHDSLWVTENFSYLVKRISITDGMQTTLLDLSSKKNFTSNDGGRWPQGGLMGMALHPNLFSANAAVRGAKPWVYVAYVFSRPAGQTCSTDANSSNPCNFYTRIVRYNYSGSTLSSPVTVLDSIPGSNDHNSGRMTIGPDLKLYYTIGDQGAGQFNNASRTNHAQLVDVMEGKILRLNTETDGDSGKDAWVPDDNPFYDGAPITPKDYVYSYGHRNAQGIVWGNVNGTDVLYSSEHGDKTDDEVNMITAGGNYGWNQVSGYCDGNYNGLTLGGNTSVNETNFCSTTPTVKQPVTTLFTRTKTQISALSSDFLTWPTVAPSSIDIYQGSTIPGWQNSLLVTCLKAGKVYRLRLNTAGDGLLPYANGLDTLSYFRGEGRFRDLAIAPDGLKIYLACDITGQTSGPTGSFNGGGTAPPNAGAILEYAYIGPVLSLGEVHLIQPKPIDHSIKVFPNPAAQNITVSIRSGEQKPFTIHIYNASGMLVYESRTSKTETELSTSHLKPGLYHIRIIDAYGRLFYTEKLIRL